MIVFNPKLEIPQSGQLAEDGKNLFQLLITFTLGLDARRYMRTDDVTAKAIGANPIQPFGPVAFHLNASTS